MRELAASGLSLSPIDARFHSILGIRAQAEGDRKRASEFFRTALRLLPTEIQALTRQLVFDIEDRHFEAAAAKLQIIGRRWKERWRDIDPLLPVLLSEPEGYSAVARQFHGHLPTQNLLINSLQRNPATLPLADRMILDWMRRGEAGLDHMINVVTGAYIRENRAKEAYLFFLLTRAGSTPSNQVFNSSFALPLSGNYFDWHLRRQSGVSAVREERGDGFAIAIRFLDTPIRLSNLNQYARLVPGHFDLQIEYEGRDLVAPKPLNLKVRCRSTGKILANHPLRSGSFKASDKVRFEVPPDDCGTQEIYLNNGNPPMSWRYRYRGELLLKSITATARDRP